MKLRTVFSERWAIPCAVLLLLLSGCSRDIGVSTVLEDTAGLRVGDKVFLDAREVGRVDRIEPAGQTPGFVVEFGLYEEHAELVQENAVTYVPLESPPRLVLVNPAEPALAVTAGGRLKGLSPLDLVIWQIQDAAGHASSLMEELALSIDSYLESEEWRETRADIDREISSIADRSRTAAERVAGELQALVESLAKTAENRAGELGEELSRIESEIDRLEAEGYEELAAALHRMHKQVEALAEKDAGRKD